MVDKRVKRRRDWWMQRMSWKKRLMDIEGQLEKGTERQRDWWRMQWASKKKKLVEDTEGQREKEIG